jgi:hypothetical protein
MDPSRVRRRSAHTRPLLPPAWRARHRSVWRSALGNQFAQRTSGTATAASHHTPYPTLVFITKTSQLGSVELPQRHLGSSRGRGGRARALLHRVNSIGSATSCGELCNG